MVARLRNLTTRARWIGKVALWGATAGCGGGQQGAALSYGDNAREAYAGAMEDFRDENCLDAEPGFRQVRHDFPYSSYAALSELRLADCLFMQEKYTEAIEAYRSFARQRPSHPEVPYARFRLAESYFQQIPEDWLLSPPPHELDQGPTREALRQVRRFITDFPEDSRVAKAEQRVRDALAILARHELYVAEYYLDRDEPEAAIHRLESMLSAYAGAGLEPQALVLLGRTYLSLRDVEHARASFEQVVQRFPGSQYAGQARAYLRELGALGRRG